MEPPSVNCDKPIACRQREVIGETGAAQVS
jgi:hypothetical protein